MKSILENEKRKSPVCVYVYCDELLCNQRHKNCFPSDSKSAQIADMSVALKYAQNITNRRVKSINPLIPPQILQEDFPL